jgi:hypothetical protein
MYKLHHKIGLIFSIFIILLAITGILLNHPETFNLNKVKIKSSLLADLYGIKPKITSFKLEDDYISTAGNKLYMNETPLDFSLEGKLHSIAPLENNILLLVDPYLITINQSGEVLNIEESGENKFPWVMRQTKLPKSIADKITADFASDVITLERLIIDIHSGRIIGIPAVLFNDLVALMMIFLAVTGFLTWSRRRKRQKQFRKLAGGSQG